MNKVKNSYLFLILLFRNVYAIESYEKGIVLMFMNEISPNKQLLLNLVTSLVVFASNLIINFFLSPYIVETIGVEANGFINLANTFITYATLVTIALNSMSGRYITIALHQKKFELANKYFNAVFIGNLMIAIILFIPAIVCIMKLENIINIPIPLIKDVKILFAIVFLNFFIGTTLPNWNVAIFATNKIYLSSIYNLKSSLLKIVLIIVLFSLFRVKVYFIGIVTLVCAIYTRFWEFYYYKKLVRELKIDYHVFEVKYIKELVASGIWNTLNQAGQMLLSGLDLLIANLFIGPVAMGMLSISKTIPNTIISLSGNITSVFMPKLTIDYAHDNHDVLKASLKQGMRITGILLTIPLTILIVYGREFYQLWLPSENAYTLQLLSILTCFGLVFTSGTQCLYNVFTITNKIKINSLLLLISGGVSTLIVFILLKTTDLGIFAIAGVSSFVNLIRNMIYTVPFAAKYLDFKWYTFFPEVFASVLSVTILSIVGSIIKSFVFVDSWIILIIMCIITAIIGLIINLLIVLRKSERDFLLNIIELKIKKMIQKWERVYGK